jgi:small subunit ribosomal protein S12e
MSDAEEIKEVPAQDPEVEEEEEEEEDAEQEMTIHEAISGVLKNSMYQNGLARGLNESAKALDSGRGVICFLAKDCDEQNYRKLITGLCRERNITIVDVEKKAELGEWAGLCKYDADTIARKVNGCSCVVVCKIDEKWDAYRHLSNHLAAQKA